MILKDRMIDIDPYLQPYTADIEMRIENLKKMKERLLTAGSSLSSFANGYLYFGFHRQDDGWWFREWAPGAQGIALIGDFNGWNRESHSLKQLEHGVWEIFIPGSHALQHGSKVKLEVTAYGQKFDRIPTYCKRVIQDPATQAFDGQIWSPEQAFQWSDEDFHIASNQQLFIYECHIGMSGLKEGVSTFTEFTDDVLPRVQHLGYNAIQLMAIAEHPYYGSYGYQVSNYFAISSRFGTPEELKRLINTSHSMGIAVFLDLVHSHAASNVLEGLGAFDGTDFQFFHCGQRGNHPVWGTKLFNYQKPEVIHFLLSNIKYWLENYHFDGFRFDGVTSMLYHDHGLLTSFDSYQKYFSFNTDAEAITYLQLAAELAKETNPNCVLIAEDMSGMPGMCLPVSIGGLGFDYRLGMGMPDFWMKTLEKREEEWDLGALWHELTQHRPQEKVIGYCESHDQALVGDKTIMFRLADQEMYWHMDIASKNVVIDRAMSLHKMIRLITCTCAGEGYLNFMGNEFGHPEWIDFPREGNGWSYAHARRRWDLADHPNLRYQFLQNFDSAMVDLAKRHHLLNNPAVLLIHDKAQKLLVYQKGSFLFAFNFHPWKSCVITLPEGTPPPPDLILHTEWTEFGGKSEHQNVKQTDAENACFSQRGIQLDCRSAAVYRI